MLWFMAFCGISCKRKRTHEAMRVAVAMSGGVDSLLAAVMLKDQGHRVLGVHMRLTPDGCGTSRGAENPSERELALHALAARFSIPMTVLDFQREFEKEVITPFVDAYRNGLTPNPCVLCNPRIKFGHLLQEALKLGMHRLATGHYAGVLPPAPPSGRFRLLRARDPSKDQSYFLHGLTQEQLSRAVFPLSALSKRDTRRWAEEVGIVHGLPEESQEVCFIPSGDVLGFLEARSGRDSPPSRGLILDVDGKILGNHRGIHAYTVGQRRGLGIASSAPYYVVEIDPERNVIRVGRASDLLCGEFQAARVNWVSIPPPDDKIRGQVRIRNQHVPAPAWIIPGGQDRVLIRFDTPQRAVTPGQAAVFYDGGAVLGGGIIMRQESSPPAFKGRIFRCRGN